MAQRWLAILGLLAALWPVGSTGVSAQSAPVVVPDLPVSPVEERCPERTHHVSDDTHLSEGSVLLAGCYQQLTLGPVPPIMPRPAVAVAGASVGPGPRPYTARCADGWVSYRQTRSGTCSRHGGVAEWGPGAPPAQGRGR